MMKKSIFNWMLMASLVVGFSMGVISCSDDDDDKKSSEEQQQEAKKQADIFWDVVGQLTSMDNYTEDYKDKTFEPTIGIPSSDNAMVRIVLTNDMETAAERFANLTGANVDASTPSFTWSNDAVGTLSYTKITTGKSLAEVDVNIKQLPRLQKIIYMTGDQLGTNASFQGTAYYRFGDVISKPNGDGGIDYWVCVRPAFGLEKKGTSHWITVSPLPKKYQWEYPATKASNNVDYYLPTGLGTNKEHMQNFAEMLYAMLNPETWIGNVRNTPKLKMFHDFDHGRVDYHNEFFWTNVCKAWEQNGVFAKIFGSKFATASALNDYIKANGLNLLYKGYSWWTWSSWNATLYQAKYKINETVATKANMHDVTYTDVENNVQQIKDLDVRKCTAAAPYLESEFFKKVPQFIVRYATGEELAGYDPDFYGSLKSLSNGIEDVYVYHDVYTAEPSGKGNPPSVTKDIATEDPRIGTLLAKNGKFYKTLADVKEAKTEALCVVVYISPADSEGNRKAVEKGLNYYGIAMGLEDIATGTWADKGSEDRCAEVLREENGPYLTGSTFSEICDFLNGWRISQLLADKCGDKNHSHPFIACIKEYTTKFDPTPARDYHNISQWFIPSVGQMKLAFQAMGLTVTEDGDVINEKDDKTAYQIVEKFLGNNAKVLQKGGTGTNNETNYWTVTEYEKNVAWMFSCTDEGSIRFAPGDKNTTTVAMVRPFILFGTKAEQ
jgi:hypothetical protein